MHEGHNLDRASEHWFGEARGLLRGLRGACEILSDPLRPPIGSSRIEAFGLAAENIWVQVNSLNCALDVTSTERVICASKAVNDVLIHPCFSFFSLEFLHIISRSCSQYTKLRAEDTRRKICLQHGSSAFFCILNLM